MCHSVLDTESRTNKLCFRTPRNNRDSAAATQGDSPFPRGGTVPRTDEILLDMLTEQVYQDVIMLLLQINNVMSSSWFIGISTSIIGAVIIALAIICWKKLPFYGNKQLEKKVSNPDEEWKRIKSEIKHKGNVYYRPTEPEHYYCALCSDKERALITIAKYPTGLYCPKCKSNTKLSDL
jgi:hypothetical protein